MIAKMKKLGVPVLAILVIALLVVISKSCSNRAHTVETSDSGTTTTTTEVSGGSYEAGISRIRALEEADPNEVDAIVKEYRRQILVDQHDELMAKMESGEVSVWSLLQDYVILGDSRGAGFKFIRQLDEDRNLATYGNMAIYIPDEYEKIAQFNPSYILLFFGINDSLREECYEIDDFIVYFSDIINDLQAHFPEAKIFINPIFPCIGEGLARYKQWERTAEYDQAVREVAKRTGITYVNCDDIVMKDEYYKDDGLHFWNDFMEIWMKHIILAIYDSELGLTTFDSTYDAENGTATTAAETAPEATPETVTEPVPEASPAQDPASTDGDPAVEGAAA